MAAPLGPQQRPVFPAPDSMSFDGLVQGQFHTSMTAYVKWDGETYAITWRGTGQFDETYARAAIEKKMGELYVLHTRYMKEGVTRLTWDGENKVTREFGNGRPAKDTILGRDWVFYDPRTQKDFVEPIRNLQVEKAAELAKPVAQRNVQRLQEIDNELGAAPAKLAKKRQNMERKQKAQQLWEILRQKQLAAQQTRAQAAAPQGQAQAAPVNPAAAPVPPAQQFQQAPAAPIVLPVVPPVQAAAPVIQPVPPPAQPAPAVAQPAPVVAQAAAPVQQPVPAQQPPGAARPPVPEVKPKRAPQEGVDEGVLDGIDELQRAMDVGNEDLTNKA